MALTLKNMETGATVHCIGLWINRGPRPRYIYALDNLQGHHALDEGMVEFDDARPFVRDGQGALRRLRPVKPWRIVPIVKCCSNCGATMTNGEFCSELCAREFETCPECGFWHPGNSCSPKCGNCGRPLFAVEDGGGTTHVCLCPPPPI